MFLFDESKIKILCVISVKLIHPQFAGSRKRRRPPPTSWTDPETSGDTVGMLWHAFDHQAPLTRPLEVVGVACSS